MSETVAVVDYGMGNLHSAGKALEKMAADGQRIVITGDPEQVRAADRVVFPGVGAIRDCIKVITETGLDRAILDAIDAYKPVLGICVGMQLMACVGHEYEETQGLGWIDGDVTRIRAEGLKVPHMGWNDLVIDRPHPVLAGIESGQHAYFVHSYHMAVHTPDQLLAHVDYGSAVTAVVGRDTMVGMQFHPEKSQATGLRMIANFLNWRP